MSEYRRFGTPAQTREADALVRRIAAAEARAADARLAALRVEADKVERLAVLAAYRQAGAAREAARVLARAAQLDWDAAHAAYDWAVARWPESQFLGAGRLRVAEREAVEYSAAHPGTPRRRHPAAHGGPVCHSAAPKICV